MSEADDIHWMHQAIELAKKGLGRTAPNPAVGCVIVADGVVVGQGWHERPGSAHAEVMALRNAGEKARGATVYVTLEPCCHHGRTPPCSQALIEAGVSRVVAGTIDPNPRVLGEGVRQIQSAGIKVEVGVAADACRALNRPFWVHVQEGRAAVTVKMASTLDGKTGSRQGAREQVTGVAARTEVHRLRSGVQAIAVGIGTLLCDDPRLTARIEGGDGQIHQPKRIIFDSQLRCPPSARVLADDGVPVFIVCTEQAASAPSLHQRLAERATIVAAGTGAQVDVGLALKTLAGLEVIDILVEGGATLVGALAAADLVDVWRLHLAPAVFAGVDGRGVADGPTGRVWADLKRYTWTRVERLGDDVLLEAVRSELLA